MGFFFCVCLFVIVEFCDEIFESVVGVVERVVEMCREWVVNMSKGRGWEVLFGFVS